MARRHERSMQGTHSTKGIGGHHLGRIGQGVDSHREGHGAGGGEEESFGGCQGHGEGGAGGDYGRGCSGVLLSLIGRGKGSKEIVKDGVTKEERKKVCSKCGRHCVGYGMKW